MLKERFNVTGMTCAVCAGRVEKAVKKLEGTANVTVNLLTNSMQLEYDENKLGSAEIIAAVEKAGYGASLKDNPAGGAGTAGNGINGNGINGSSQLATGGNGAAAAAIAAMGQRLLWSIVFLIPTMYIAMHHMLQEYLGIPVPNWVAECLDGPENAIAFAFSQFLLVLPIMYLNRHYYISGFKNLFLGDPNMDSLVGMGSMASALFGAFAIFRMGYGLGHGDMTLVAEYSTNLYFESAGMIVTLITVGKYLEAKAKGKTSQALEKLISLAPKQARVIRNGQELVILAEQLQVGDEIVVRPGEAVPADGTVISGSTSIDESAITGESIPVEKAAGSKVTAATINKTGCIHFQADRVGNDTTIRQIIRLVDEASASKAPIACMADSIAGIFVPAVIAIAVLVGGGWYLSGASVEFSFSIAISILVISCPCALGLATPVAIMVGTGKGAENGILIKSGEALERAQAVDTVVMDKTGTITEGRPQITDVAGFGIDDKQLLAIAAGLEQGSEHPLAEAILQRAEAAGAVPLAITDFQAKFGRGVQGSCQGKTYYAGNSAFMQDIGHARANYKEKMEKLAAEGKTPVIIADDKQVLGILAAFDVEKPTSAAAINQFKELGIQVVMLTGDNARTAEALQKKLGIPQVIAGVLPADKEAHIRQLQETGHRVAMIGDGINDAPALARADVGIAIGAGTDVAIESADAVLVRNDLLDAVSAIRLSRAVIRNIKENLFWAFFYNVICIPTAAGLLYPAFGIKLSPMLGAAAMSMSSVCVVMNALRLRWFKPGAAAADDKVAESALEADVINAKEAEAQATAGSKEEQEMKTTIKVEGMMCMHCQKHVHDALAKMEGVTDVVVNLEAKTAEVTANREIGMDEFAKVITDAGYELVK